MSLASRVKLLRTQKGYSQTELGRLVGGVPYQSIQNLESGKVTSPRYIIELARVLEVSTDYLFHGITATDTGTLKISSKASLLLTDQVINLNYNKKMFVISIDKSMALALSNDIEIMAQVTEVYNKNN